MIPKRIVSSGWFGDRSMTTLLDVHSRGFDKSQMQKIAADDFVFTIDIKPEKGHSFLHVVTTGAGEWYGPNNNGDWFNKTASEFRGANGRTIQLAGGLEEHHNSFMKHGAVYRQHNNSKKGGKPQGQIIAETVNPAMHRGELIIKVANDLWHDDLEKLASGDLIWWSMGCGVPYDICSICLNKAPTRQNYCEHARYNMCGIDKEGHMTFVANDWPLFHDLSEVGNNPADRIAGTLQKVAEEARGMPFVQEDVSRLWVPLAVVNKIASRTEQNRINLLTKLAEIEKRIKVEGMTPAENDLASGFEEGNADEIEAKCGNLPLDQLISVLNSEKMMLPPKGFIRIVMKRPLEEIAGVEDLPDAIKDIFSQLQEDGTEEILDDGSYEPSLHQPARSVASPVKELSDRLSLEDEPVRKRIVIIAIRGGKPEEQKTAARRTAISPEAKVLAKEYAKYQLSFLAASGSDEQLLHTVAIHNQAF
jgi:hypothetical protein